MIKINTRRPVLAGLLTATILTFAPTIRQSFAAESKPTPAVFDKKVSGFLKQINDLAGKPEEAQDVNEQLMGFATEGLRDNSALLDAKLPLSKGQSLVDLVSSDKNVHLFSYDSNTGGSMHYFRSIVQFKSGDKVYCSVIHPSEKSEGPDCGSDYYKLYTIKTNDGKTVYVVTYSAYFSHSDYARSVTAYEIKKDEFVPVPFFNTKTKKLDTIDCNAHDIGFDKNSFITLSPDNQKLLIPIVTKEGKVTGKFLTYKFDGNQFLFDPSAK